MAFVTFEGIDGSGKTTQAKHLVAALDERDIQVVAAKEPDGGHIGGEIRQILVKQRERALDAYEEALLVSAARYNHVRSVVRPALDAGIWVVCDRFIDSTFAFQVFENHVAEPFFDVVSSHVIGQTRPDVTFILDLDAEAALQRRDEGHSARHTDPAEAHRNFGRIRRGLLEAARRDPQRCHVIDATGDEEGIATQILDILRAAGHLRPPLCKTCPPTPPSMR